MGGGVKLSQSLSPPLLLYFLSRALSISFPKTGLIYIEKEEGERMDKDITLSSPPPPPPPRSEEGENAIRRESSSYIAMYARKRKREAEKTWRGKGLSAST